VGRSLARDLETIGKREYPRRFRPVYVTIAERLPEAIFEKLSMRQFAERLGISWRTIRDCIWYMRRIGFEIPYTVLPYR
jgi:DNA-binding GntR family transcriptional regulator